jgi:hypothetical protein
MVLLGRLGSEMETLAFAGGSTDIVLQFIFAMGLGYFVPRCA